MENKTLKKVIEILNDEIFIVGDKIEFCKNNKTTKSIYFIKLLEERITYLKIIEKVKGIKNE